MISIQFSHKFKGTISIIINLKYHSLACAVSKEILVWDTHLVDKWILLCCFLVNVRMRKTTMQIPAITMVMSGFLLVIMRISTPTLSLLNQQIIIEYLLWTNA